MLLKGGGGVPSSQESDITTITICRKVPVVVVVICWVGVGVTIRYVIPNIPVIQATFHWFFVRFIGLVGLKY